MIVKRKLVRKEVHHRQRRRSGGVFRVSLYASVGLRGGPLYPDLRRYLQVQGRYISRLYGIFDLRCIRGYFDLRFLFIFFAIAFATSLYTDRCLSSHNVRSAPQVEPELKRRNRTLPPFGYFEAGCSDLAILGVRA